MILTRIAAITATLIALTVSYAEARPNIITCNQQGCSDNIAVQQNHNDGFKTTKGHRAKAVRFNRASNARSGGVSYLPHPPGCPRRAFCACGAAVEIFGKAVRSLWPTRAWLKFPRTSPAPQMAAVKPGHMFVLKSHVEGNLWLVNDYNSGGHMSRQHVRSIDGYTIVNPHGKIALN